MNNPIQETYGPLINGSDVVMAKKRYAKAPVESLRRELKKCEKQLRKINGKIGFEIRYGDYNALTSPLQEEKEKKLDKIIKIKKFLEEKNGSK